MKQFRTILLTLLAALTFAPAALATPTEIPSTDSYVDSAQPTTNFGSLNRWRTDASGTNGVTPAKIAYFEVPAPVANGGDYFLIKITPQAGANNNVSSHICLSEVASFGESTVTWNNRPSTLADPIADDTQLFVSPYLMHCNYVSNTSAAAHTPSVFKVPARFTGASTFYALTQDNSTTATVYYSTEEATTAYRPTYEQVDATVTPY